MRCKQWIFDMDGTLTDSMTVVWRGAPLALLQRYGRTPRLRLRQPGVKPRCGAPRRANAGDARVPLQQPGNVVGDGIPYGAVCRPGYGAGGQNVPQRQPVPVQQLGAARSGLGVAFPVYRGQHRPKAVLRVGIVKGLGTAAGAGHRAEDQGMAVAGDERRKGVQNGLRHGFTSVEGAGYGPACRGASRRAAACGRRLRLRRSARRAEPSPCTN